LPTLKDEIKELIRKIYILDAFVREKEIIGQGYKIQLEMNVSPKGSYKARIVLLNIN
jgi:hypothetical protein